MQSPIVPFGRAGLCWAKMRWVFSGEAVTQSNPSPSPCLGLTLRMAARHLIHLCDTALTPSELKLTQFSILAELAHRGTNLPTMGELAQAMVMDRSTLGHNLRPLERDRHRYF
jgi:hypothetical protein